MEKIRRIDNRKAMEENLSLEFILATIEQKILYLEEHPETKANGFYTRRLATKYGEIENLKVPRVRDGIFKSSYKVIYVMIAKKA